MRFPDYSSSVGFEFSAIIIRFLATMHLLTSYLGNMFNGRFFNVDYFLCKGLSDDLKKIEFRHLIIISYTWTAKGSWYLDTTACNQDSTADSFAMPCFQIIFIFL